MELALEHRRATIDMTIKVRIGVSVSVGVKERGESVLFIGELFRV